MFMEFSGVEKARELENRVFIQGLKEGRFKKKNATWRSVLRKCLNSGYTLMRLGKIGVLNSGPRFPLCVLFTLCIAVPGGASGTESACQCRIPSLDREDALEESMATHSGILACRIPLTEEPGRLQFIESGRVRHDWSDFAGVKHAPIRGWTGGEICMKMSSHPSNLSARPSGGATLLGSMKKALVKTEFVYPEPVCMMYSLQQNHPHFLRPDALLKSWCPLFSRGGMKEMNLSFSLISPCNRFKG